MSAELADELWGWPVWSGQDLQPWLRRQTQQPVSFLDERLDRLLVAKPDLLLVLAVGLLVEVASRSVGRQDLQRKYILNNFSAAERPHCTGLAVAKRTKPQVRNRPR